MTPLMWRKSFDLSSSLAVVLVLVFICTVTGKPQTQRPNIILIVADDLGWNDVSFHGSDQIPTPNIDALAYSGVILNNYYVQPICTPTRAALLTGRHPIHLGLQHGVLGGAKPDGLGLNETLLPQYLHRLGYRTHVIGKWHLGMYANEFTPTYRGFETHYGYYQGAEDYFDHTSWQSDGYKGLDFRRNMEPERNVSKQYSTELFTSESERIIHQHNQSEPLFLYLAHQAVHIGNYNSVPLQVPEKYIRRFAHIKSKRRRTFAGMVSALDDSVGNVTKALHSRGLLDNSIIVFTTDNGGPANGYGRNCACNWPLRGVKHTLWEGGVRGVGFVWSPLIRSSSGGQVEPQVSSHLMHVCDWLPTLIHIAGGQVNQSEKLDGFNMWNSLTKGDPSPRTEILHNIDPTFKDMNEAAIRVGNYKLLMGSSWPLSSLQWDGWYSPTEKCEYRNDDFNSTSENLGESHAFVEASDYRKMKNHEKIWNAQIYKILNITSEKFSKPVIVSCNSKPVNSSRDCNPMKRLCLFDVVNDPCEFHNIASEYPEIAQRLLERLLVWNATAVPIKDSKDDPRGNPANFNNTWTPWINLTTLDD